MRKYIIKLFFNESIHNLSYPKIPEIWSNKVSVSFRIIYISWLMLPRNDTLLQPKNKYMRIQFSMQPHDQLRDKLVKRKSHQITKIKWQTNNTSWNTAETKKAISKAAHCNDNGKKKE